MREQEHAFLDAPILEGAIKRCATPKVLLGAGDDHPCCALKRQPWASVE